MRRAARTDQNQKEIVKGLRELGYSVAHTHMIGKGFPDIVVGVKRSKTQDGERFVNCSNFLFEVKDGAKTKSQQKLTPDEEDFFSTWEGQVSVITCVADAIQIIEGN